MPAAGNSSDKRDYLFTDNDPIDGYYRASEHDADGKLQYTKTVRSFCAVTDAFKVWPNPVKNTAFIKIDAGNESRVLIRLFDSKGALVKLQTGTVLPGINQFSMDMESLAKGMYLLHAEWNNGQIKKSMLLVKE